METIEHSKVKKKGQQDAPLLSSDFQISAAADQGGRKYMEDRLQIEIGRNPAGGLEFIFAAIYDGHGGVQASEYASTHLFQNIVNNQAFYSNDDNEVMDAIRAGFLRTQNDMLKAAEQWPPTLTGFPCTAGTTVTCAIIRDGKLFTGHVGDSSIILANFAEEAAGYHDAKLTEDHKPENKTERMRIEKAGGAIATKSGIYRVIWKRPIRGHRGPVRRSTSTENVPFLAVARALGDFWSYNPDTGQYVVSPEPDVDVFRLKNSDNFIVVASDGLTNVLSTQAIIGLLRDEKRASTLPLADGANKNDDQHDGGLQLNYAHSLMQNALQKWGTLRADNISIICIKLGANDEIGGQQHPFVAEEIPPGMDIGKQLIEHPFATVHVNKMRTFRLINTQLVATNANDDKSTTTTGKQQSPVKTAAIINGGEQSPVKTAAIINGGEQSPVKEIINGECHHHHQPNKEGGGGSEGDSDREEEAEKEEEETAKEEEEEVVVVVTNAAKVNPNNHNNDNIFKVPFMRAGVKRRIQDVEDGGYEYVRHIPSTSSNALQFGTTSSNALQFGTTSSNSLQFSTTSSKTSSSVASSKNVLYHQKKEEEQQEEEDDEESMEAEAIQMKPPPAKRSKLQSVFNFFTNLFKW